MLVFSLKKYCRVLCIETSGMSKDFKTASSWVRQLRHRAKKHNLFNDLSIEEIHEVIESFDFKCCLCGGDYYLLDTCFPLKDNAPNIQANVMTLCKECKSKKKNLDLLQMCSSGLITRQVFSNMLKSCFKRNHGDVFKSYVKALSGYIDG